MPGRKCASVYIENSSPLIIKGVPIGVSSISVNWGKDHPNNYEFDANGFSCIEHAELHAARRAIRNAAKQKYGRIILYTGSYFVWQWIKNAANFAESPPQLLPLIQSIWAIKTQIKVNVVMNEQMA